jgi:hypothetical protein
MNLEEHTLEGPTERCEDCGAQLTKRELELALERGGPNLCTIHANEVTELDSSNNEED